jgi:multidrug efflux pump subunit AcrA (membrane-fusion protein)
MQISMIVLGALVALTGPPGARPLPAETTVKSCFISAIEEAQVPAKEAGVLMEVAVKENQQVAKDDVLARIDDVQARTAYNVAYYELKVAEEEATNDANINYSIAANEVADFEYKANLKAAKKLPGAFPELDLQRLAAAVKQTGYAIDKARMDFRVAKLKLDVAKAKLKAAEENVRQRQVRAPLGGEVADVRKRVGEWVQPGEVVAYVVRMDPLRIETFLSVAEFEPHEIAGRTVTVNVPLARGARQVFHGKIVSVGPLVQTGGEFRIRAEVQNRKENGDWVLQPGRTVEMTIHLK